MSYGFLCFSYEHSIFFLFHCLFLRLKTVMLRRQNGINVLSTVNQNSSLKYSFGMSCIYSASPDMVEIPAALERVGGKVKERRRDVSCFSSLLSAEGHDKPRRRALETMKSKHGCRARLLAPSSPPNGRTTATRATGKPFKLPLLCDSRWLAPHLSGFSVNVVCFPLLLWHSWLPKASLC